MAEGAGNAVKYGLAGIAVGTATGVVTDMVFRQIGNMVQWSGEGNTSKLAVHAILAGTVSSVMLYGGSMVLENMMDVSKDPLYLIIYYNTAVMSQNTIRQAISGVRQFLPNPMGSPQSPSQLTPKPVAPGPVMNPPGGVPPPPQERTMTPCAMRNKGKVSGAPCGRR